MRKIPTVFVRNDVDRRYVTDQVNPGCEWVLAGEGVPTRKYDGTCVMLDGQCWWARREVKPGKAAPASYRPEETDPATGKTVGWEPIAQSAFVKPWSEALENDPRFDGLRGGFAHGTYELCGPKVNGNPEGYGRHRLIEHATAEVLNDVPLSHDGLAGYLAKLEGEGIVWHHEDGRMAKLKVRDFPR